MNYRFTSFRVQFLWDVDHFDLIVIISNEKFASKDSPIEGSPILLIFMSDRIGAVVMRGPNRTMMNRHLFSSPVDKKKGLGTPISGENDVVSINLQNIKARKQAAKSFWD